MDNAVIDQNFDTALRSTLAQSWVGWLQWSQRQHRAQSFKAVEEAIGHGYKI